MRPLTHQSHRLESQSSIGWADIFYGCICNCSRGLEQTRAFTEIWSDWLDSHRTRYRISTCPTCKVQEAFQGRYYLPCLQYILNQIFWNTYTYENVKNTYINRIIYMLFSNFTLDSVNFCSVYYDELGNISLNLEKLKSKSQGIKFYKIAI